MKEEQSSILPFSLSFSIALHCINNLYYVFRIVIEEKQSMSVQCLSPFIFLSNYSAIISSIIIIMSIQTLTIHLHVAFPLFLYVILILVFF